ncbi:hypothetical protein [Actinoallomurus acaciae]|uniref:Uncharacterized protein n=1 Tax=Actinoallomurus acaciae TaxID=502577 RepID=A0ABV5YFI4_9ACTN
MAHHRTLGPFSRTTRGALVAAATVMAAALAPAPGVSAAMTPTGGGGAGSTRGNSSVISHAGNGRFNKNSFDVNDPSVIRGNQNITNQNIGGQTATQNAICKRWFRHCRINERMIVRDP